MVPEAPPLAPVVARNPGALRGGRVAAAVLCRDPRPRRVFVHARGNRQAALRQSEPFAAARSRGRAISARPAPLAVTQIDHTPTDIQFVEVVDGAGTFVGRAYLTILVDVFSRCILGFCLTLEAPSTLSVALCLAHAICRKEAWLRGARPSACVADVRAAEANRDGFGEGVQRRGVSAGLRRIWRLDPTRDRGRVHEGGVVERLLGKLNGVIGRRDGATGSSIADRDGYPSEKRACLTFADLERCVALAIIDHNGQMNEKTLKVPLDEWRARIVELSRRRPTDAPERGSPEFSAGAAATADAARRRTYLPCTITRLGSAFSCPNATGSTNSKSATIRATSAASMCAIPPTASFAWRRAATA